jgi:hypothetical protein
MRIWDVPACDLCNKHLLGEHAELHAIWNILTQDKKGYSNHPETVRWRGRLKALYLRHDEEVSEMVKRGFRHHSDLDPSLASGDARQTEVVDPVDLQERLLEQKDCGCTFWGA